jgi:hypothetical protein
MKAIKPKIECLFVALIVLMLAGSMVSAATASRVKLDAPGSYKIVQDGTFNVIQMESFSMTDSPGDPMLPHKVQDILLPPDVIDSTVKLNVVSVKTRLLEGTYNIRPAGFPVRGDNKNIVNGRNVDVYKSNADYPASSVKLLCCSQMRKWKFARVDFIPFQYNPVSGKLTLTESVEIEISYSTSPAAMKASLMRDTVWQDVAARRFINYAEVSGSYVQPMSSEQPSPSPVTHDYVIITTSAINTNSTKLNAFVAHKQSLGYNVLVVIREVSIDGLVGQAPNHRAEKIRKWLIDNYASEGIKYVLLIGDPHPFESGEGDIPMKMCHPERNAFYQDMNQTPTDYFYADLTGNWDIDNDLFYGEWDPGDGSGDYPVFGGVDFTPEVYVGRIPVYNSDYTTLDNILQKLIDYESASGNLNWRLSTLLPMGFQDSSGPYDGAQLAEQMQDDYLDSAGYSNWRMYQQGSGPCGDNSGYTSDEELRGSPAVPNVKDRWSSTDFGIVCWWAHGDSTSADVGYSGCWDGTLFQNTYCPSIDDNYPAFTYQCSCDNGYPEVTSNLQYSILKQGGIGTVSATRVSWFSTNIVYGQFDGSVTNSGIGYEYVARLVQNLGAGDSLYLAKSSMSPSTHQCWLMNWYDFNLYGDPSLAIGIVGVSPIKWEQPPDKTYNGIDIRCDRADGIQRTLADDFNCTRTGPITKVTLWGSWRNDIKGQITKIHLSIHSNDPCGPMGFSEPNQLLWERDFYAGDINETLYSYEEPEWFWDPTAGMPPPIQDDHYQIWQYDIPIDSSNAFVQQGDPCNPVIYWLDAYVELDPNIAGFMFGWKTSSEHWNDDAVWDANMGMWHELRYPMGHPLHPLDMNSIDLAFVISTGEVPEAAGKKLLESNTKWSQPPIEIDPESDVPTYCGWDEQSHNRQSPQPWKWKIVADDFRCIGSMPVTSIHWWGSFSEWGPEHQGELPPILPANWWIGFWSNVPAGAEPNFLPYSYPKKLLHSITIPAARVDFNEVGSDEYGTSPHDICYQYNVDLAPNEVFWQDDFNGVTDANIYWISIVAEYNVPSVYYYQWGWKTRPWSWMDDAVTFVLPAKPGPNYITDPCQIMPIVDPMWQESFDMAFELDTDPNYIKWEQNYNGKEDWWLLGWWKFDEGSGSVANDSSGNHRNGTIYGSPTWQATGSPAGNSGYLKFDGVDDYVDVNCFSQGAPLIPSIYTVSAWFRVDGNSSNPADPNMDIISITDADANHGLILELRGDKTLRYLHRHPFQYVMGPNESIYTTTTYNDGLWHHVAAVRASDNSRVLYVDGQQMVSDSNVTSAFDAPVSIILGALFSPGYPSGGRFWNGAIDDVRIYNRALSATEVTALYNGSETGSWPHYEDVNSTYNFYEPEKERLVADDWRCVRRTPVTAIVWWGSYIGYGYEACSSGPFMPLPVSPDRFRLMMWTDVAADPCDPCSYSHPDEVIWQYNANAYDEVLVGYDKHPEGEPNEPVFRYSVRLPEDKWFHQPNYSEVFWLSVQAIYDFNMPNYVWGWTNHKHVFNDDAVSGYFNDVNEVWVWTELFDQTGASEDMSFILFTDPNVCSTCANYNCDARVNFLDYADFADAWLWTGPAGGYNNSDLNCDGSVDFYDLKIFVDQWLSSCP